MARPSNTPSPSTRNKNIVDQAKGGEEEDEEEIVVSHIYPSFMIPDIFTGYPPVRDALVTDSSVAQDQIANECRHFVAGEDDILEYNEHGVPRLSRDKHIRFLHLALGGLPGRFVAVDASRPWFLYWAISGLTILGEDVSRYRNAVAETARSMQNDTGGFGGGCRQLSHMATSYAVVLALALVGGEEAFEVIDRKAIWRWLCRLKQPDGGFQVCLGGEEDIRGAYCAAVIIKLLNLPLDLAPESPAWTEEGDKNLLTGLGDYVRRCQTFEGGISGQPDAEAHGAYAFCALGCLSLLGHPSQVIPRYLDVPRLIAWLSSRQYAPEGGFSGRTNKLVDGCYSHWVGGCFPLIEACLSGATTGGADLAAGSLPPAPESLFSREGLIRYILCCCQDLTRKGGLRDKPGKSPDAYHSCYVLSGLSSAQHQWELVPPEEQEEEPASAGTEPATSTTRSVAAAAVADPLWVVLPYFEGVQIFDQRDRVRPIHPVYAIPHRNQQAIRNYFLAKEGF
ncbi:terpenoid cyclases/protein prenyltransferase alpha-alpha toroid [Lasiosphaeria miniovina]|uniref:Protein farnesyltransferase subunit beta n=1 Tax=Lasiosphaeria miniovina TaxID=1954250 RepID=A0AA40DRV8_9PEZI|nr:terpenoid cyclases/protein prenyltransferase alpha-alpha toroid [Lasiosphaeria miniovina]KAK0709698.1 terpenoid cyclases/protein prenyltransferase alpha-alpha toroid [Lasiosphaeria miniovina]